MENHHKNNKKKRSGLPTQMGLIFRMAAGGYLMYLAYNIYNSSGEVQGMEKIAFAASIVLFGVIGVVVIVQSLRAMQRGEYEGGAGDHRKDSVSSEEEAAKPDRIKFGEPETMPERESEKED